MPELTVADEMEFESWPLHMQQLAFCYVETVGDRKLADIEPNVLREDSPRVYGESFRNMLAQYYLKGFNAAMKRRDE